MANVVDNSPIGVLHQVYGSPQGGPTYLTGVEESGSLEEKKEPNSEEPLLKENNDLEEIEANGDGKKNKEENILKEKEPAAEVLAKEESSPLPVALLEEGKIQSQEEIDSDPGMPPSDLPELMIPFSDFLAEQFLKLVSHYGNPQLLSSPPTTPDEEYKPFPLGDLVPCQMKAIDYIGQSAKAVYTAMMSPFCVDLPFLLPERVRILQFTMEDAKKAARYMAYEAPAIIHFPPTILSGLLRDGVYQNRFETGSSSGALKKTPRQGWEDIVFNDAYKDASPSDRPKYGTLNLVNDGRGVMPCKEQYGAAYLQLKKDIRHRITFADMDTSNEGVTVVDCNWKHMMLLMHNLTQRELNEVLSVATGKKPTGDSSVLSCYKEIQIHGSISLMTDVERIVIDSSYFKEGKKRKGKQTKGTTPKAVTFLLDKIKEKYGIPWEKVRME